MLQSSVLSYLLDLSQIIWESFQSIIILECFQIYPWLICIIYTILVFRWHVQANHEERSILWDPYIKISGQDQCFCVYQYVLKIRAKCKVRKRHWKISISELVAKISDSFWKWFDNIASPQSYEVWVVRIRCWDWREIGMLKKCNHFFHPCI